MLLTCHCGTHVDNNNINTIKYKVYIIRVVYYLFASSFIRVQCVPGTVNATSEKQTPCHKVSGRRFFFLFFIIIIICFFSRSPSRLRAHDGMLLRRAIYRRSRVRTTVVHTVRNRPTAARVFARVFAIAGRAGPVNSCSAVGTCASETAF